MRFIQKHDSPLNPPASGWTMHHLPRLRGRQGGGTLRKAWLAGAAVISFFASLSAFAVDTLPPVESFSLKNGMEVIVIPNHRVPAVSHMLWFRIGSADDPPMQSGLAHYHEHMMFKGTEKFRQGQYESLIAAQGGQQNAFTNYDATGYYVNIAKDKLPLAMELEADRMRGLKPDPKEALKEREVIMEERRMRTDNNPQALLSEQMNAALFLNHPYHTPVIGWMHEMAGLKPEDVLAFHKKYYHPDNAILVISGDTSAAEIRPLAEKYYGSLPKRAVPERIWKEEPPARTERHLTLKHANVKQPIWERSYLAPSLVHGDTQHAFPLMVLAQVLGAGRTGILYQELVVKQQLATSISAQYGGFSRGPDQFAINAVPAANVSPEKLEAAINALLDQTLKQGIPVEAVIRAKSLLKAEAIYAREGLQPMAYLMGMLRILGLEKDMFTKWPELIEAVTPEQVQEAAKAVLKPEASVTGLLLPAEGEAHE